MFKTFSKNKQGEKGGKDDEKTNDASAEPDAFEGIDSFMMSKRIEPKQSVHSVSNFQSQDPTTHDNYGLDFSTQSGQFLVSDKYLAVPNQVPETMDGLIDMQLDQFINQMDSMAYLNQQH